MTPTRIFRRMLSLLAAAACLTSGACNFDLATASPTTFPCNYHGCLNTPTVGIEYADSIVFFPRDTSVLAGDTVQIEARIYGGTAPLTLFEMSNADIVRAMLVESGEGVQRLTFTTHGVGESIIAIGDGQARGEMTLRVLDPRATAEPER